MPLFEMKPGELIAVPSSTFANEKILERADLQRLLRARIDTIADDVLIVAEEFGAFSDARRRIDLLGIDREGRLVVFELKRTLDGGHLELQALRYAAMISTMTFDDLVGH
jgi:RecB family endonuclease NucS